ncbi:MAG TPA: sensor domain-containing protein [Actinomycetota bacterium]
MLLRPWRRSQTWWELAYTQLGFLTATVTFSVVITLLATTAGLLIVLPLAIPFAWLLFVVAEWFGRMERSRLRGTLGIDLAGPHAPESGSWWAKLKARAGSGTRWREIGFLIASFPVTAIGFTVTVVAWSGSAALLALPAYLEALPNDTARFGLFDLTWGPEVAGAVALGLIGLVLIAPWTTVGVAAFETAMARRLLGPAPDLELSRKVERLEASRTAAVDSAEAERRRIERDLHDGAQQRLVSLAMGLGQATERFDSDLDTAKELVVEAHGEAKAALGDLRDLVRGFHPAILEDRGLDAALSALAARAPVPVTLNVDVAERPSLSIESTAYFVVTEALTNVAKHAKATRASVSIVRRADRLVVEVTDDGVGGADPLAGSGLRGLTERISSVDGWMQVLSPDGGPTTILVELPCGS